MLPAAGGVAQRGPGAQEAGWPPTQRRLAGRRTFGGCEPGWETAPPAGRRPQPGDCRPEGMKTGRPRTGRPEKVSFETGCREENSRHPARSVCRRSGRSRRWTQSPDRERRNCFHPRKRWATGFPQIRSTLTDRLTVFPTRGRTCGRSRAGRFVRGLQQDQMTENQTETNSARHLRRLAVVRDGGIPVAAYRSPARAARPAPAPSGFPANL